MTSTPDLGSPSPMRRTQRQVPETGSTAARRSDSVAIAVPFTEGIATGRAVTSSAGPTHSGEHIAPPVSTGSRDVDVFAAGGRRREACVRGESIVVGGGVGPDDFGT